MLESDFVAATALKLLQQSVDASAEMPRGVVEGILTHRHAVFRNRIQTRSGDSLVECDDAQGEGLGGNG